MRGLFAPQIGEDLLDCVDVAGDRVEEGLV
jgi:hypothetical protein